MNTEWVWSIFEHLTYTPHGGSGLGWTRADCLDATVDELDWACRRLDSRRQAEAEALKRR